MIIWRIHSILESRKGCIWICIWLLYALSFEPGHFPPIDFKCARGMTLCAYEHNVHNVFFYLIFGNIPTDQACLWFMISPTVFIRRWHAATHGNSPAISFSGCNSFLPLHAVFPLWYFPQFPCAHFLLLSTNSVEKSVLWVCPGHRAGLPPDFLKCWLLSWFGIKMIIWLGREPKYLFVLHDFECSRGFTIVSEWLPVSCRLVGTNTYHFSCAALLWVGVALNITFWPLNHLTINIIVPKWIFFFNFTVVIVF